MRDGRGGVSMIACLAGFFMGLIGSMPIAGPTSVLVFHRGSLARYRDGWAIGLGGALVEGMYCSVAVHARNRGQALIS